MDVEKKMGENREKACFIARTWRKRAAAFVRETENQQDLLPYLSYGRQQTLSPLGNGTNPQQLGEGNRKNPSALKGEAGICPEYRTTNDRKAKLQEGHIPKTQGLPKTKVESEQKRMNVPSASHHQTDKHQ